MFLLLLCFEPATTAASMAMDGPKTMGDALRFRGRSAAEDAVEATFLAPRVISSIGRP